MIPESKETRIAAGALIRGEATVGPRLVVLDGPDAGRALALDRSLTVGRAREADLRISDPSASRLHARLTVVDGRVVATDLSSKNGLRLNGGRFRAARPLGIGEELVIGATRLTIEPGLLDGTTPGVEAGEGVAAKERGEITPSGARTLAALLAAAGGLIAAAALLWL